MPGPKIPTTKEVTETNVANYEAAINQTVPLTNQAFARVQSAAQAMNHTGLYKYGADAVKENLALTASKSGLTVIGKEHNVFQKGAVSAVLKVRIPAAPGTVITAANKYIGFANGEFYTPDADGVEEDGFVIHNVTADDPGDAGNLSVGAQVTLQNQVPGAGRSGDVIEVVTLGVEEEELETFRARVLFEIRTQGGGGNAADYKRWGELVPGVKRCYPYSGRPLILGTVFPIERTVFVEVEESVAVDGIAPQIILDDVRESIERNAEDGKTNQPLGLTNETLWVESIYRDQFFVEIRGFDVEESKVFQAKQDIETEIDRYFRSLFPFVDSVDPPADQNNIITTLTVSTRVQDILNTVGGTATSIGVGPAEDVFFATFTLNQGQTAKLGLVKYA
jgi:hypothetical protein